LRQLSQEAAEASAEARQELLERRFDGIDLLVIYIDGMQLGEHHIISALGVDGSGHKHVLGMQQGATENAAAVEDLLEQVVARGVDAKAKRLFVIEAPKPCVQRSTKYLAHSIRCNVVAITRFAMCASAYQKNRRTR